MTRAWRRLRRAARAGHEVLMESDEEREPATRQTPGQTLDNAMAVVSGKGGVGKTNLVANLAVAAAALDARVLAVDGDLGLANLDVLLGLLPRASVADLLSGEATLDDILVEGPRGLDLLPAHAGSQRLAAPDPLELEALVAAIGAVAPRYDLVLMDAGAGVGSSVVRLCGACRRLVLVTNPEPTSLADAYGVLKVLTGDPHAARPHIDVLVNEVDDARDARDTYVALLELSRRYLGVEPGYLGHLPRDARLGEAVHAQRAVVELHPASASARRLIELAHRLLRETRAGRVGASQPEAQHATRD